MKKSDIILIKVTEYLKHLVTPILSTNKTGILDKISARIGTLSVPSKMPCHAWSIPAKYCITGSKLAKISGTPCSMCYAQKGRYVFNNVQFAQEHRLFGWHSDPDWVNLMTIRLLLLDEGYFRWFDSGDLQSDKMLEDINKIALNTPNIEHWLPTTERGIVAKFGVFAPNLTVRISSTKIGSIQDTLINGAVNSLVTKEQNIDKKVHKCPSKQQKNKCQSCRACWDKSITHVAYLLH